MSVVEFLLTHPALLYPVIGYCFASFFAGMYYERYKQHKNRHGNTKTAA